MSSSDLAIKTEDNVKTTVLPTKADAPEYPSTTRRIIIMMAMYLGIFLVNLDQNIISTAIPRITDEFHSLDDIGWYGSAYLLTTSIFQLLMGKIYKFFPVKLIFLICCAVFEIGSLICATAPGSTAFIIGRGVAGVGASGIFSGVMMVIFNIIPLQQRPIYQGFFAAVFSVASVIGPLLGGTFTDNLTWRWCFYINLPIGAVSMVVTVFILRIPNQKVDALAAGWWQRVQQFDPFGILVIFPAIVCLILALQWGGIKYSWADGRIVVLFIIFGLLTLAFIGIQIWKKENATIPPRLLKQRSIAGAAWYGFFNGAGIVVLMYYLPIWFQAIKDVDAVESGIMLLPLILCSVFGSIAAGIATSKVGYYNPFFLFGSVTMPIAAGLMSMFTPSTSRAMWVGAQALFGLGFGVGVSLSMSIAQTVLNRSDVATGVAFIMFLRLLGSTISLPVAQTIFLDGLVSKVTSNLPNLDAATIVNGGATELRQLASGNDLVTLLTDYNDAIVGVFLLVVGVSAATIFGTLAIEWRNLKSRTEPQTKPKKEATDSTSV